MSVWCEGTTTRSLALLPNVLLLLLDGVGVGARVFSSSCQPMKRISCVKRAVANGVENLHNAESSPSSLVRVLLSCVTLRSFSCFFFIVLLFGSFLYFPASMCCLYCLAFVFLCSSVSWLVRPSLFSLHRRFSSRFHLPQVWGVGGGWVRGKR